MNTPVKQLINLLKGWPSISLLPTALLAEASGAVFTNAKTAVPALCYGPDPGHEALRVAISQWLTSFYKHSQEQIAGHNATVSGSPASLAPIEPAHICITGGASQNLACALQVFSDPLYTRGIWCVSPMYFLAGRIFQDNGFDAASFHAVPEDEEGLDIAVLEEGLLESETEIQSMPIDRQNQRRKPLYSWNKHYRHIIYVVPTFSNPSSRTMSLQRRIQLVRLARRYDALIIADDVYDQLQWHSDTSVTGKALDTASQPRIVDVDRILNGGAHSFGNAMSNGSFSKIVGPGVRTGWAEGSKDFVYGLSQCGSSRSGGAPSQTMAVVLTHIVESGQLQKHITTTLQPAYAARYAHMMKWIEQLLLPLGVKLPQGNRDIVGGYFIWLELPNGMNGDGVTRRAKDEENLILGPGSFFAVPGKDALDSKIVSSIRVCLSWEDENLLQEGIRRLASVIKRMLNEGDDGNSGAKIVVNSTGE